jgi:DNA recombination protein RmuC
LAIQLSRRLILRIYGNATGTKKEVEKLRINLPRSLRIANKILEEKSNKFTEQNKENMKSILSFAGRFIFEKSRRYAQSIDYHAANRF